MNDEQAEAQNARVMALYEKWVPPLGLGYQKITFSWCRGSIPGHEVALMTCAPEWQYRSARICVDLVRVADASDEDLEWAFVHELVHVFLGGVVDAYEKGVDGRAFRLIEENTASALASAFLWLRAHVEPEAAPPEVGD